jgi:choline kinase
MSFSKSEGNVRLTLFEEFKASLKTVEAEEIFDLILFRPVSFVFVKMIYNTNITPNHISIVAMIIGVIAGLTFAGGTHIYFIIASLLYFTSNTLDCADGQLARLKKNGTLLGRAIDGFIDYVVSTTIYICLGVAVAKVTGSGMTGLLLCLGGGISAALQAFYFDFYRNSFLQYVHGMSSDVNDEIKEFEEEKEKLKDVKGRVIEKLLINAYLFYSRRQSKMVRSKTTFTVTPEQYYKDNRLLLRLWSWLGSTTHMVMLMFFSIINRLDLYLIFNITICNIYFVIILIMQKKRSEEIRGKEIMQAIILAAGLAKRLRPLTDTTPKCLLEVNGKNLLHRTIDNVVANGITDFVFVTGYREEMIKDYLKENFPGLNIQFISNHDFANNNNSYSLWMTKDFIKEDIILLDSDILFDKGIIKELLDSKHENCLAVNFETELDEEQIKVVLDDNKKILEISKVTDLKKSAGESIGIERFSFAFMQELYKVLDRKITKENNVNEFYEKSFEEVIQSDKNAGDERNSIYAIDVSHYKCMEIDTVEDYERAKNMNI